MRPLRCLAPAILALAVAAPVPAAEAPSPAAPAIVRAIVLGEAVPAIRGFAVAAAALDAEAERLCAAPATLGAAQARFRAAYRAWSLLSPFRRGPLETGGLAERIAFWPDKRNVLARQLAGALAARDARLLDPAGIAAASAALQGLPALERLLFDDPGALGGDAYRCALAARVAAHVANLAGGLAAAWGDESTGYAAALLAAPPGETLGPLLDGYLTALALLIEHRLGAAVRPEAREGRRAGIALALAADSADLLRALYEGRDGRPGLRAGFAPTGAQAQADRGIRAGLAAAVQALRADASKPGASEQVAADEARQAARAVAALKSAHALSQSWLPDALGVTVGFNALDGD